MTAAGECPPDRETAKAFGGAGTLQTVTSTVTGPLSADLDLFLDATLLRPLRAFVSARFEKLSGGPADRRMLFELAAIFVDLQRRAGGRTSPIEETDDTPRQRRTSVLERKLRRRSFQAEVVDITDLLPKDAGGESVDADADALVRKVVAEGEAAPVFSATGDADGMIRAGGGPPNADTTKERGSWMAMTGEGGGAPPPSAEEERSDRNETVEQVPLDVLSTSNVDLAVGALRRQEIPEISCVGKIISDLEVVVLAKLLCRYSITSVRKVSLAGEQLGFEAVNALTQFVRVSTRLEELSLAGHSCATFAAGSGGAAGRAAADVAQLERACERLGRAAWGCTSLRRLELNCLIPVGGLRDGTKTVVDWRLDNLGERAFKAKGITVYDIACLAGLLAQAGDSALAGGIGATSGSSMFATGSSSPSRRVLSGSASPPGGGSGEVPRVVCGAPFLLKKLDFQGSNLTSDQVILLYELRRRLVVLHTHALSLRTLCRV